MITIDLSEQAIEVVEDTGVEVLVRLTTCGLDAAADVVRVMNGADVEVDFANRVSSRDRPDYVVRERSLVEAGSYEVISTFRGGHSRRFVLTLALKGTVFEVLVASDEKTTWLYNDEPHVCAPGNDLRLTMSLDAIMQRMADLQAGQVWTEEEAREDVIRERYDDDDS